MRNVDERGISRPVRNVCTRAKRKRKMNVHIRGLSLLYSGPMMVMMRTKVMKNAAVMKLGAKIVQTILRSREEWRK